MAAHEGRDAVTGVVAMKRFWLIAVCLLVLFSITFTVAQELGWFTEEGLKQFIQAQGAAENPWIAGGIIAGLLAGDLLLPLPSSILMTLSGFFCGVWGGLLVNFVGAMVSALIGFGLCRAFGQRAYQGSGDDTVRVEALFERYGSLAIIISRGFPMLTEILSCLAGLSSMTWRRFMVLNVLGSLPLCTLYAWAGHASRDHGWIGVAASLGVPALAFVVWHIMKRGKWGKQDKTQAE